MTTNGMRFSGPAAGGEAGSGDGIFKVSDGRGLIQVISLDGDDIYAALSFQVRIVLDVVFDRRQQVGSFLGRDRYFWQAQGSAATGLDLHEDQYSACIYRSRTFLAGEQIDLPIRRANVPAKDGISCLLQVAGSESLTPFAYGIGWSGGFLDGSSPLPGYDLPLIFGAIHQFFILIFH